MCSEIINENRIQETWSNQWPRHALLELTINSTLGQAITNECGQLTPTEHQECLSPWLCQWALFCNSLKLYYQYMYIHTISSYKWYRWRFFFTNTPFLRFYEPEFVDNLGLQFIQNYGYVYDHNASKMYKSQFISFELRRIRGIQIFRLSWILNIVTGNSNTKLAKQADFILIRIDIQWYEVIIITICCPISSPCPPFVSILETPCSSRHFDSQLVIPARFWLINWKNIAYSTTNSFFYCLERSCCAKYI